MTDRTLAIVQAIIPRHAVDMQPRPACFDVTVRAGPGPRRGWTSASAPGRVVKADRDVTRLAARCMWLAGGAGAVCAALLACEDVRPVTVPRMRDQQEVMVRDWNGLEARLEADNEARVHARLAPDRNAELNAHVARAASLLHEAHRALEQTRRLAFPEQAREEKLASARVALDEAEDSVSRADSIRASTEPSE